MAFIQRLLSDPLALIFTLISVAYFVTGVRLAREGWQRRQALSEEPLNRWKARWADRSAFYVAIPPGVFIHELGHALAVWAAGGTVAEFGYGFYWGYIIPSGSFTATQNWFISIAGTVGTLVYALVVWWVLEQQKATPLRYFGRRILRFHLYYALLYYPLFTLFTFIGDWRTIYNFEATPYLSSGMLVIHLLLLAFFWWSDRQGWYEMPVFESAQEQTALAALQAQAAQQPYNEELQLRLIDSLRRSGARKEAEERLRLFLNENPQSARAHLIMAALKAVGKQRVPAAARDHAQQALQLGLADGDNAAYAHSLLAQYYMEVEKMDEAVAQLDEAIALAGRGNGKLALLPQLYYSRARAERRQGRYDAAYEDIEKALQLARAHGREEIVAHYENERKSIVHQAGGKLSKPL